MATYWYVLTDFGCTIYRGGSEQEVWKQARLDCGRFSELSVRPATEEDISWVRNMGGTIHETRA